MPQFWQFLRRDKANKTHLSNFIQDVIHFVRISVFSIGIPATSYLTWRALQGRAWSSVLCRPLFFLAPVSAMTERRH